MARSSTARATESAAQKTQQQKIANTSTQQHGALDISIPDLDRVIHEKMRLGIVSALAVSESLTFNELKRLLQTTDGNLSVHARRLEEANYVKCTKTFEGRMPKTEYKLTPEGRHAFERYLNHMEALIHAMRER